MELVHQQTLELHLQTSAIIITERIIIMKPQRVQELFLQFTKQQVTELEVVQMHSYFCRLLQPFLSKN